jgi:uncharacterized membrane protein (Fun14 family)
MYISSMSIRFHLLPARLQDVFCYLNIRTHLNQTYDGILEKKVQIREILSSLGFQLGAGGIGGFIVGYAVKKIGKLIVIIIGLFVIALIYLSMQGVISINYNALFDALANLLGQAGSASSWLISVISMLPFAASFTAGFLLGLKLGQSSTAVTFIRSLGWKRNTANSMHVKQCAPRRILKTGQNSLNPRNSLIF